MDSSDNSSRKTYSSRPLASSTVVSAGAPRLINAVGQVLRHCSAAKRARGRERCPRQQSVQRGRPQRGGPACLCYVRTSVHTWQGGCAACAVLGSGKGRPLTGTITPKRCTTGIVLPAAGGHLCILVPLQLSAGTPVCWADAAYMCRLSTQPIRSHTCSHCNTQALSHLRSRMLSCSQQCVAIPDRGCCRAWPCGGPSPHPASLWESF